MLPKFHRVRRRQELLPALDPEAALVSEWLSLQLDSKVFGKRIAIGVGSRGIRHLPVLVKTLVNLLRLAGAEPFLIPAMGSHGGATSEGQREVLRDLGITESSVGCPIHATMETVVLGQTAEGIPAHLDALAAAADGFVFLNRVKPHTSFHGPLESGLHKMLAIGMGKEKAATLLHAGGPKSLRDNMPQVAKVLLEKSRFLAAFGVVEDAQQNPVALKALTRENLEAGEMELLALARKLMPTLPLSDWDVVVVDEMGKDVSGTGMDTHIIGRMRIRGEPEPESPRIASLVVLGLTPATHGNALGIGLADFTTESALASIDFEKTRRNVLATGNLERGRIPLVCAGADDAVLAGLNHACRANPVGVTRAGLLRIRNTLRLEEFFVSEGRLPAIRALPNILSCEAARDLRFTPDEWSAP